MQRSAMTGNQAAAEYAARGLGLLAGQLLAGLLCSQRPDALVACGSVALRCAGREQQGLQAPRPITHHFLLLEERNRL